MMKIEFLWLFLVALVGSYFMSLVAFADPSPLPMVLVDLKSHSSLPSVDLNQFLSDVMATMQKLGGLPWSLKVASASLILVAAFKVSVLDDLLWKKLGGLQAFAAPTLALVSGLAIMLAQGQLTLAGAGAYLISGAGAIALHELLDAMKMIPGLGPIYVSMITLIESKLGGNPVPNPGPDQLTAPDVKPS